MQTGRRRRRRRRRGRNNATPTTPPPNLPPSDLPPTNLPLPVIALIFEQLPLIRDIAVSDLINLAFVSKDFNALSYASDAVWEVLFLRNMHRLDIDPGPHVATVGWRQRYLQCSLNTVRLRLRKEGSRYDRLIDEHSALERRIEEHKEATSRVEEELNECRHELDACLHHVAGCPLIPYAALGRSNPDTDSNEIGQLSLIIVKNAMTMLDQEFSPRYEAREDASLRSQMFDDVEKVAVKYTTPTQYLSDGWRNRLDSTMARKICDANNKEYDLYDKLWKMRDRWEEKQYRMVEALEPLIAETKATIDKLRKKRSSFEAAIAAAVVPVPL